ncbi:GTP-binding protein [Actinoallomurus acanthiterrae]
MYEELDLDALIATVSAAYAQELAKLGRFNSIVFGDSGAGKTTLVNAIFGMDLAETGIGRPVTKHVQRYRRHDDDIITIYDNRGFEVGHDGLDEMIAEMNRVVTESRIGPREARIHAAWFVVNSQTSRFLESHEAMVRAMHALDLPVIMVLTHVARLGDDVDEGALRLARHIESLDLPLSAGGRVFLVNSVPMRQIGGPTIPEHGLRELLRATLAIAPEAARALKAGQRLDFSPQRRDAKKVIKNFRYITAGAGATAAVPVPLTDVGGVTAAIAVMIAKISLCYGLPIDRKQVVTIAAMAAVGVGAGQKGAKVAGQKAVTNAAGRLAGRAVAQEGAEQVAKEAGKQVAKRQGVKQLGKFVPVMNLVIGAVNAGTALTLAIAVGHAWMHVCEFLLRRPALLAQLDTPFALRLFQHYFKRRGSTAPGEGPQPADPTLDR